MMSVSFARFNVAEALPGQVPAYNAIAALDLQDVEGRIRKDEVLDEATLVDAVDEYRKFLFLVSIGNRGMAMCSREVDEVWHNHILFTEEYRDFCQSTYGGFMHHKPATPRDPMDPEAVYRFHTAYASVFGPLHPIWGNKADGSCIVKPPFCEGRPPQCEADCGCKCKEDEDD